MLPTFLSAWLLPAVALAAAIEPQTQEYTPRSLDDTIQALELGDQLKDLLDYEDERRGATRCSAAVRPAPVSASESVHAG